ncbi:Pentatricopeptide repeat-containing protein [Heracleum sosnowskyi]|uniref:Pentatricopeptide repeat-containing protein n=1 Tax=Heracleum sosnowskyi TaxID=360622 RepID=A0AAD8IYP4_9APIA|nr:Pentatricopeptide repeat-containing protein [Heracleum sosnowskyi]
MHSLKCTIIELIHSCKTLNSFKQIHAQLITSTLIHDDFISNKVTDFLGKSFGFVDYACKYLIHQDFSSNSYPFNTLIASYANCNKPEAAFLCYKRFLQCGFYPDMFSFPVVLKSCTKICGIGEGKQIHGMVLKMGFACDLYVRNSMIHFYGSCGDCVDAGKLFDEMTVRDVVSWSGLISGCVRAGLYDEAILRFKEMDIMPNVAGVVSVVVACGFVGDLNIGKGVHGLILKRAFEKDLVVSNALLNMYVKCECLGDARRVFRKLNERDVVSWTSMISGLVMYKCSNEALDLFDEMLILGVEPDKFILTSILSACANVGALSYGRRIHDYIDSKSIVWDAHIGTSMIDMYFKCGCIEMALRTFSKLSSRNVLTWNALLGGLAVHGYACCHSGMADEGLWHFYQMETYNISPGLEHYGCIVNLLCKADLLDEAQNIVRSMPMPPDAAIWGSLLSACNTKGNVELSQDLVDKLHLFKEKDSGVYVLCCNKYAINEKWDDLTKARRLMKENSIEKSPGLSVIEIRCTS